MKTEQFQRADGNLRHSVFAITTDWRVLEKSTVAYFFNLSILVDLLGFRVSSKKHIAKCPGNISVDNNFYQNIDTEANM